jgi:formate-dependent nitrite reductase membrane component NrfD
VGILAVLLDPWRKAILSRVPDWCLSAYCMIVGLAFNWAWAYSYFSRFALTSGPVLRRMTLLVALSAVIGLLAALLHDERKWQLAAVYFALASGYLSWAFHG